MSCFVIRCTALVDNQRCSRNRGEIPRKHCELHDMPCSLLIDSIIKPPGTAFHIPQPQYRHRYQYHATAKISSLRRPKFDVNQVAPHFFQALLLPLRRQGALLRDLSSVFSKPLLAGYLPNEGKMLQQYVSLVTGSHWHSVFALLF